jgi:hypothetical protein
MKKRKRKIGGSESDHDVKDSNPSLLWVSVIVLDKERSMPNYEDVQHEFVATTSGQHTSEISVAPVGNSGAPLKRLECRLVARSLPYLSVSILGQERLFIGRGALVTGSADSST